MKSEILAKTDFMNNCYGARYVTQIMPRSRTSSLEYGHRDRLSVDKPIQRFPATKARISFSFKSFG